MWLVALLLATSPAASDARELVGMIEGTEGIFVTLVRDDSRKLSGTLRYRQPRVELALAGTVDVDGALLLDEVHATTQAITGKLRLMEPPPFESEPAIAFIGTWTKPDGSGARAVTLQDRARAFVRDNVVVVADARLRTVKPTVGDPYRALPKVPRVLLSSPAASRAAKRAMQRRIFLDEPSGKLDTDDPFKSGLLDDLGFDAKVIDCFVVVATGGCSYRSCSQTHANIDVRTGEDRSGLAFFRANSDAAVRRLLQTKYDAHLSRATKDAPAQCSEMLRVFRKTKIELAHLDVEAVAGGAKIHLAIDHGECAPPAVLSVSTAELTAAMPEFKRCAPP